MTEQDTRSPADDHPREDDRNDEIEGGTPVPDPLEEPTRAEDDPGAD